MNLLTQSSMANGRIIHDAIGGRIYARPAPVGLRTPRDYTQKILDDMTDAHGWHAALQERWPVFRTRLTADRMPVHPFVRREIYRRDGFECALCPSTVNLQLDHLIPWSANGSERTDNIRALCAACNEKRSNRHVEAYVNYLRPMAQVCVDCESLAVDADTDVLVHCTTCNDLGRSWSERILYIDGHTEGHYSRLRDFPHPLARVA